MGVCSLLPAPLRSLTTTILHSKRCTVRPITHVRDRHVMVVQLVVPYGSGLPTKQAYLTRENIWYFAPTFLCVGSSHPYLYLITARRGNGWLCCSGVLRTGEVNNMYRNVCYAGSDVLANHTTPRSLVPPPRSFLATTLSWICAA